ncbi:MAG TPA: hypothetical protein VGU61_08740 [Noviherbaspirillum sp.]|nr:hypothetical protein [Noviherbaspirillum sp.]HEV2610338.1 hypothetical protein [Noviherbaspirillum sp.]
MIVLILVATTLVVSEYRLKKREEQGSARTDASRISPMLVVPVLGIRG